ncbi:MAG: glutamine synthetase family protein [Conexibacter sp.]
MSQPESAFWPAHKLTLEQLEADTASGAIDTVVVTSADIQGKLFGKRVPADLFVAELKDGIHLASATLIYDNDWAFLEGFPEIGAQNAWADMHTIPDLRTLRRYSHIERTAICLADCQWADHSPVEYLPRRILQRQLDACAELGYVPVCAAETEFFLFDESFDSAREKNWHDLARVHRTLPDYSIFRSNLDEQFMGLLRRHLIASGIPIESVKHEWGQGQNELALVYCEALEAADRITLFKSIVKEVADQQGKSATFMARYDHRESGSSGHVHQSLWSADLERNLLADDEDPSRLSELGRWWLGGQMALAPDLMPLFCPNVNSYKRLNLDTFGPTTMAWGLDVRTVPYRLVGSGRSMNFENRIPGADANFYLAIAGMVAAGLHGIEHRIEPPSEPVTTSESVPGEQLPITLPDALDRFEASEFARAALGEKVVEHLVVAGRHELDVYRREVSDIERRRYFQWA